MALEMLVLPLLARNGAQARMETRPYLQGFPDVLAGLAPGFGGPEVVRAAHAAMQDLCARIIALADQNDRLRAERGLPPLE